MRCREVHNVDHSENRSSRCDPRSFHTDRLSSLHPAASDWACTLRVKLPGRTVEYIEAASKQSSGTTFTVLLPEKTI
jgi:hypothetical protein